MHFSQEGPGTRGQTSKAAYNEELQSSAIEMKDSAPVCESIWFCVYWASVQFSPEVYFSFRK